MYNDVDNEDMIYDESIAELKNYDTSMIINKYD